MTSKGVIMEYGVKGKRPTVLSFTYGISIEKYNLYDLFIQVSSQEKPVPGPGKKSVPGPGKNQSQLR